VTNQVEIRGLGKDTVGTRGLDELTWKPSLRENPACCSCGWLEIRSRHWNVRKRPQAKAM